MGEVHIPIIDEDKLDDIITAIQALSAPSGTNVAISPTGMHIVTEDDVQGAISELDAKAYEINSSLTHNLMTYEDVTVVTGSTQYVGYYYGDGSITTSVSDKEIVSAFVYSATSNRPAFLQRIGATSVRAFCPVSDTTIVIRVLFKHN